MGTRTHPPAAGDGSALTGGRIAIAGRDAELALVAAAVDGTGDARITLIEGEAGIGKSMLWEEGVRYARDHGLRVLASRPAESEADLPFSALSDLLATLDDAQLAALPDPQRIALDAALVRSTPPAGATGRFVAGQALLTLLRVQPPGTLVAVDDVQWLDGPTAQTLAYAARRLGDTTLRLLLARRSGTPLPTWLARDADVHRVEIGPLAVDALDRVVRGQLAVRLPRPRLVELHDVSRGNPYYALEIVRALQTGHGGPGSSRPLPVPESVTALLGGRLRSLSKGARDAALLVAAAGKPPRAQAEAAAGARSGLDEAVDAGVLELDGDRVRFAHPLLASASYQAATPSALRAAHRRLADTASDRLDRARHLSLATDRPDVLVAEELEAAAALASARGAPSAAAKLLDRAAALTPDEGGDDRRRRLGESAEQHYRAGDQAASRGILEALVAELPRGPERARRLSELSQRVAYQVEGLALCRRALAEAGDDDVLASDLHFQLAAAARRASTLAEAAEHAHAAVERAAAAHDPARSARALAMLGYVQSMQGSSEGRASLERAAELERSVQLPSLHFRPGFLLGITLLYLGELYEARPLIEAQVSLATEAGDEVTRGVALSSLAELELRAGDWSTAYRYAEEAAALQQQAAPLQDQAHHVLREGRVLAHLGDLERARPLASALLELAPANGDKAAEIVARRDLGFIELSAGNHREAVTVLDPALALLDELGVRLYSAYPCVQDYVEAAVALPDLDSAAAANARLAGHGRPWEDAMHARGLALLKAGAGDLPGAIDAAAAALAANDGLDNPFERARTLLVQGTVERRAKRRSDARRSLTEALELFDALGAPLWAEKAAAELARIPGRAASSDELTETERRVAELVRDGLSNKEVAARLFVTVRTVEANLSKVYAKLGIRSRTELAQHL